MRIGTRISRNKRALVVNEGSLHLAIAVAMLPGYFLLGQEFKFIAIPYVMFLVLSKKAAYLPAILMHFLPGTLVSQAILLACALLGVINLRRFKPASLALAFVVNLAALCLVAYPTIHSGRTVIQIGQHMSLLLGLSAFYYGVLVGGQVDDKVVRRIIIVLIVSVLLQIVGWEDRTVRYVFFAVPAILVIGSGYFLPRAHWSSAFLVAASAFIVLSMMFSESLRVTFIMLFSTAVASLFILARLYWTKLLRGVPIGKLIPAFAVIATISLASPDGSKPLTDPSIKGIDEVQSTSDLLPAIKYKLVGDRAVLWSGAWETIRQQGSVLPPTDPPSITFRTLAQASLEADYGAHNIGLELLRNYGWVVGFLCIGLYFAYLGYMAYGLLHIDSKGLLFPMLACSLAVAFVGGLFGHFVLDNNFSFILFAVGGAGYGSARLQQLARTRQPE